MGVRDQECSGPGGQERAGFREGLESEEGAVPRWGKPAWAETALSRVCPVSWHECEPVHTMFLCAKLCVRDQTCPGSRSCQTVGRSESVPVGLRSLSSTGQGAKGVPVAGPEPGAEEYGWEGPSCQPARPE